MTNLQQLITNKNEIETQCFDLLYEIKYLTENLHCLTILGDNDHPEYGYMTITEQTDKLSELTSQLSLLVKENLEINQAILKEMIKKSKDPTISKFLKILHNLSDRTLELNDVVDILLSINIHQVNVGDKLKRSLNLFFSSYNEKYAEQKHTLNILVTDNIITKIHFE